jgi:cell division septum initiation protein DivIVA
MILGSLFVVVGVLLAACLALLVRARLAFGRERLQLTEQIGHLERSLPSGDVGEELRRTRAEAEEAALALEAVQTRVVLLEDRLASTAAERDSFASERNRLASECDVLASERNSLVTERDDLTAARDALETELKHLREDHARLSGEVAGIRRQRDEARQKADEEASRRKLAEERALPRGSHHTLHPGVLGLINQIRELIDPDGTSSRRLSETRDLLPATPQHPSLSGDAVADSVVDGADLGALVVRAASTCGDHHRRERQHRRDSVLLRMPTGRGRRFLLSSVAAGAPDGAWSQSAAAHACRALETQVVQHADRLVEALDVPAGGSLSPETQATLRLAVDGVGRAIRTESRLREWVALDGSAADRAVATTLTAVMSPLEDRLSRTHLVFGVGDGAVLRLRDGRWERVFQAAAVPGTAGTLPNHTGVTWTLVETRPGELLAACTRPMADLLLRKDVGRQLADLWTAGQPTLTWFLSSVFAKVEAAVEDRSLVCLWDFGYAADAEEDQFREMGRGTSDRPPAAEGPEASRV